MGIFWAKSAQNAKRLLLPQPMTPEDEALGVSEEDLTLSIEDSHLTVNVSGFRDEQVSFRHGRNGKPAGRQPGRRE